MRLLLALALACAPIGARAASDEAAMQNVVVKPGDTLWSIARAYLKDPARWDEILKHNKLPTADPTVALPGMVLRVPVRLIKNGLRAAQLVYAVNRVLHRRRNTADWKGSKMMMELYEGDTLRTLEDSKARVKFLDKELLNLEPSSMAVIKPSEADADVELRAGSVFVGHARVVTATARVTPRTRDTRYSASIEPDLSTKVEVFKGLAAVDAQGSRVEVPAGMETRVAPGLAPEVPKPLENMPALEARAQEFASALTVGGGAAPQPRAEGPAPEPEADAAVLRGDIDSLHVGTPILGYHVQAASDREFTHLVFNKKYDVEERFSPVNTGLPAGAYWWRIASIDLLGTEGPYSEPRYYTVGVKRVVRDTGADLVRMLNWISPVEGATIKGDAARVTGVLRDDRLHLEVNGKPARIDADGNFVVTVPLLGAGANEIILVISDGKGNTTSVSRRVTRL